MKIGLLGPANSIHTIRIANELKKKGHDVTVCSLPNHVDVYSELNCDVQYLKYNKTKGYYLNSFRLKRIAKKKNFDLLNAHYASGYGTLGRISKIKPLVISVWGSDIFSFPRKGKLYKAIIKKNLFAADRIFATSNCIKEEVLKYIVDESIVDITPFGIDLNKFQQKNDVMYKNKNITLGFLKGTAEIYGIDLFLEIVCKLKEYLKKTDISLKVKICGAGDRISIIQKKIFDLKIQDIVDYQGYIRYDKMPDFIKSCDIICIPSREESFGVVAVESMACGVPCIVSSAPGLKEVILDGKTGFIIDSNSPKDYIEKIRFFIEHPEKIRKFGQNGRKHVENNYEFSKNIDEFIEGFKVVQKDNF